MAKEDFCFTYYDGDAARDMAHMNRLERGAYTDIIISQRKFGALTMNQIKKILGKDFDECWQSIELVLKIEDEKYFIDWVKISIEKSRRHSKKQKENVSKRKVDKPNNDLDKPKCILDDPLGNGNGNEYGKGEEDLGKSENPLIVPEVIKIFKEKNLDYADDFQKDAEPARKIFISLAKTLSLPNNILKINSDQTKIVLRRWGELVGFIVKTDFIKNYQLTQIEKNIQNILLNEKNGSATNNGNFKKSGSRVEIAGTGGY